MIYYNSSIISFKLLIVTLKYSKKDKKKTLSLLLFLAFSFLVFISMLILDLVLFNTIYGQIKNWEFKYFIIKILLISLFFAIYHLMIKQEINNIVFNYLRNNNEQINYKNNEIKFIFDLLIKNKFDNKYLSSISLINIFYIFVYLLQSGVFINDYPLFGQITIMIYSSFLILKFLILDIIFSKLFFKNILKNENQNKIEKNDLVNYINYVFLNILAIVLIIYFIISDYVMNWNNGFFISYIIIFGLGISMPLVIITKILFLFLILKNEKNKVKYIYIFLPLFLNPKN